MAVDQALISRLASGAGITTSSGWLERSYRIALRLDERDEWSSCLPTAELPWLKKALESQELWDRFISPQPEQWRFYAPPPPIFEIGPSDAPASLKQGTVDAKSGLVRAKVSASSNSNSRVDIRPNSFRPGSSNSGAYVASKDESQLGKRAAIQNDSGNNKGNSRDPRMEKRARTSSTFMDSDDDMLSVLSGSDIDLAMWTGTASLTSGAVSPESTADLPTAKLPQETNISGGVSAAENTLVCAIAAFHARSVIFEQYISVLCGDGDCTRCMDTAIALEDISKIELQVTDTSEKNNVSSHSAIEASSSTLTNGVTSSQPALLNGHGSSAPLVSRGLDEDEDYDDDDDDDVDDGGTTTSKVVSNAQKPAAIDTSGPLSLTDKRPGIGTQNSGSLDQVTAQLKQGLEISKPDAPNGIKIALKGVFRTLDELDDAVHEQQMHESNVRQIKEVMEQRAAEPKDMLVNKIGALQNMKNLAQFIDNHRDSVNMSTRELSHLLSEVRPKRTKWANERRVGQVELYEALEHVLQELKSMGEPAIPFLSQVKRKDAPDYYKVIKHPMDLGTMAKNLRNEAYNNKKQFTDHLQLIRDNCYTYNTEPGNYYRKSADTLLAKAKQLMESVPDIVIRERGSAADDTHTECGDESGNESLGTRTNSGHREESVMADDGTPAPGSMMDLSMHSVNKGSVDEISTIDGFAGSNGIHFATDYQQHQQQPNQHLSTLAQNIVRVTDENVATQSAIAELTEGYEKSLCEKVWRNKTRQRLAEYSQQMDEDADSQLADRHASQRTAEKMHDFIKSTHESPEFVSEQDLRVIERQADITDLHIIYSQIPGSNDAADIRRRNEELDVERNEWLRCVEEMENNRWKFVSECELAAGLPQLESLEAQSRKSGVICWLNDDCEKTVGEVLDNAENWPQEQGQTQGQPSIEAFSAGRFPDNAMWRDMADNIERMKNIREIDGKIWATKLNMPIGHPDANGFADAKATAHALRSTDESENFSIRDLHGDYPARPDPQLSFELDATGARNLLQRTSAFMLMHVGFESVTAPAMASLLDFLIDYMTNLGCTLRTYMDKHGRTMSTEAILAHALYSNGIEDLGELEYFLRSEVGKYSNKLVDIQKNLSKSYKDIMADGKPDAAVMDPAMLEGGDAFITGMVGGLGDLGDDFFGFKELGLDKEFGIEQLSVPQRLWYSKSAVQSDSNAQAQQQDTLAQPPTIHWTPIAGTHGQIKLLHPFISEKLKALNGINPPGFEGEANSKPADSVVASEAHEQIADGAQKGNASAEDTSAMPEEWLPIPEDEDLPVKSRFGASRPKAPPPNYLTHPRTHMHVGSGKSSLPASGNRSAKKKPTKTTAASKTTSGSKTTKKKTVAA
ncbi:Transcriptional activator spt7 [Coemansia sp. RSA 1358]|uniref:Transcriptional activator spt7 n=1 Tax=Coemansia umbellata TaxID=1424467 RepID=A0ABQ8PFV7_9FUNG|nr:Transcriptional activator spt7 [Coemansia umbellata]KAJ2621084.1 Transcriptional activator spt7 [Coemansia sp. RSA 1358]